MHKRAARVKQEKVVKIYEWSYLQINIYINCQICQQMNNICRCNLLIYIIKKKTNIQITICNENKTENGKTKKDKTRKKKSKHESVGLIFSSAN